MHMHVPVRMHVCVRIRGHMHVRVCVWLCVYVRMRVRMHVGALVNVRVRVRVCVYARVYQCARFIIFTLCCLPVALHPLAYAARKMISIISAATNVGEY